MVNSIAQPLVYSRPCTTATTDPYTALLHVPDEIEEWVGIEEAAIAFCTSIPDSEPLYKGWSPSNVKPSNKFTVQDCMDGISFVLQTSLAAAVGSLTSTSAQTQQAAGCIVRALHGHSHMHVWGLSVFCCIMQGLPDTATVPPALEVVACDVACMF